MTARVDPPEPGAAVDAEASSAWRQPILWLVVAMPLAMVVAGVFMVRTAIGIGSTDVSPDRVQRLAQIQTTSLDADIEARARGLAAMIQADAGAIEVLPTGGSFDRSAPLSLLLLHPVDARADRLLTLQPSARGWRVRATLDRIHDWQLQLRPADGHWRLQGRWSRLAAAATLEPSVRAPEPQP